MTKQQIIKIIISVLIAALTALGAAARFFGAAQKKWTVSLHNSKKSSTFAAKIINHKSKMKNFFYLALAAITITLASCGDKGNEPESAFVDLGLPSGTLWKNVNESGLYKFDEAISAFGQQQMPSKTQWEELLNHCTWTPKGDGYEVSGNGHKIYLPAEGGEQLGSYYPCIGGYYWSTEDHGSAVDFLYFGASINPCIGADSRDSKYSVRLIQNVK